MKKRIGLIAVAVAALLVGVASSAQAAETSPHKGFFLGAGVLGGGEIGPTDRFGGGAAARLGYGVNDQWLLYLDNNYLYTRKSGANFSFYDALAKAQWYPVGNFYLSAGGGLAVGQAAFGAVKSTKLGFATSSGVGYEFRPKDQLALSVESGFTYKRISSTNFYTPHLIGRLDYWF
ncbi:MAG: hypothetical protein HY696_03670 [Deltaproteobacteria bacterium]|nr:hypothetical protein [Deltaproteobacteria bacterium]